MSAVLGSYLGALVENTFIIQFILVSLFTWHEAGLLGRESAIAAVCLDIFTSVEVEPPQQLMSIGKRLDISCCGSSTSTEVYNWPSQSECSNVRLIYLRRHSLQRQHPAVTCLKSGKFPLADRC